MGLLVLAISEVNAGETARAEPAVTDKPRLEGAAPAMMIIVRIPLKTAPSGDDDDAR
jgi:hypothetical protein